MIEKNGKGKIIPAMSCMQGEWEIKEKKSFWLLRNVGIGKSNLKLALNDSMGK